MMLVFDVPETRNAVSTAVMTQLGGLLDTLESAPPAVLRVRGGGSKSFVSGGDLKELARVRTVNEASEMAVRMRSMLDRLGALPCPVVAELNGDAYGGGAEVAIAGDVRIAAADARLGFTQIRLGITPAWGGIERLTELVGRSRAMFLLMTGTVIDAEQALSWGLVDHVVPRADFDRYCQDLATMLAGAPRVAAYGIKDVVGRTRPLAHSSPEAVRVAVDVFAQAWVAEEHWILAEALDVARRQNKGPTR